MMAKENEHKSDFISGKIGETLTEKKRFGRRAAIGIGTIVLITAAFYHIVYIFKTDAELMKLGLDLFGTYSSIMLGLAIFIITGLSATDILLKKKA